MNAEPITSAVSVAAVQATAADAANAKASQFNVEKKEVGKYYVTFTDCLGNASKTSVQIANPDICVLTAIEGFPCGDALVATVYKAAAPHETYGVKSSITPSVAGAFNISKNLNKLGLITKLTAATAYYPAAHRTPVFEDVKWVNGANARKAQVGLSETTTADDRIRQQTSHDYTIVKGKTELKGSLAAPAIKPLIKDVPIAQENEIIIDLVRRFLSFAGSFTGTVPASITTSADKDFDIL